VVTTAPLANGAASASPEPGPTGVLKKIHIRLPALALRVYSAIGAESCDADLAEAAMNQQFLQENFKAPGLHRQQPAADALDRIDVKRLLVAAFIYDGVVVRSAIRCLGLAEYLARDARVKRKGNNLRTFSSESICVSG
jgi:hypothetical protein